MLSLQKKLNIIIMWNDLDMHDRHKLIRLAVTNGVYDLDTIHSLYDNNEYKDGGNMRIAPYKDNASYPDRKLYRNVKRDFRKDPEAEYKDYEDYGVRVYNPSLSSDAPNRKERQDIMLDRIKQDFPDIQKNDVKKTAFKSNNLGWHNNTTGYMGAEDKRTLFGLQQNYDFVNNIVPYGKLGMETPESIQRREELERRNRNTTFDYTNNFDIGGDLPTDPNRPIIDTQSTIDKIRTNNLAKYAMRDSTLQQIQDLTNRMYEEEIKRRTMEWLNPSNYTDKGDMVNALRVPVAEARPTFINTYEKGGPKDPPKYSYQWQDDSQRYVKPANGTQGTSSEVFSFDNPMDPWNRFNYNQGNYIKSGIVTDAIGLGLMAAPAAASVVKPLTTLISKPVTTAVKTLGTVNPFIATDLIPAASFADNSINAALAINGISNAFSNNGLQKTYNHFKNKEYYSGLKSGLGDALDLSGMIGIAKALNTANKAIQQTRLGQNVLDNVANKVFYLDEPIKFNNWLKSTEANARQKVSDINKYRREHGLMENYMNDENIFSGINDNIYIHYPYSIYEYGKIQMPNMLKNKISNIKKAYETANSTQGINYHGHILINPRHMDYKIGKSKQSNYLEGLLGHEIDHSYQPHLSSNPAIPGNNYYIANPESPHYNVWKILNSNQKEYPWGASPREVLSELTNWKIENNSYLTPFKDINDARNLDLIENTALRFNLSYPQSRDLLKELSELGYF